jgi:hypothetical protein
LDGGDHGIVAGKVEKDDGLDLITKSHIRQGTHGEEKTGDDEEGTA